MQDSFQLKHILTDFAVNAKYWAELLLQEYHATDERLYFLRLRGILFCDMGKLQAFPYHKKLQFSLSAEL